MEFRTLPNTDLSVSRLAFGSLTFGKSLDQDGATRLVGRCIDGGINLFDSANVYELGVAETMLGQALRGRRSRVIVASKVGYVMGPAADESGLSAKSIFKSVEQSLQRLQTDYLDIYYLHLPDPATPLEETMEAVQRLVEQGKVRYPATSNHASWQVLEMLWKAAERGYKPYVISQQMLNLIARGVEQEYTAMARRFGVSIITYNPLAGGLLTGRHSSEQLAPGSMLERYKIYTDRYRHDQNFQAVQHLARIAADCGRSLVSLALSWLLHHTAAASVILGASSVEQMDQNIAAATAGALPREAVAACDQLWKDLRGPIPFYNR